MSDHMTTPNAAELRAAKLATDEETIHGVALVIRSSLHLDEVREALNEAVSIYVGMASEKEIHRSSWWFTKAAKAEQALKHLSE